MIRVIGFLETPVLFAVTAVAEIFGCWLVFRVVRAGATPWLLLGAVASLALFAFLLTLPPMNAAGRIYAAYGGVYVATAVAWTWIVEKKTPDAFDLIGAAICIVGMTIIVAAPRGR